MASNAHAPDSQHYYVPHGSPWPIVAAVALFALMWGAVAYLNDWGGAWVFLPGPLMLLYMFGGWFHTVIGENQQGVYNTQVDRSFRMGMLWFIFSEVMFFAAFFGALFYSRVLAVPWLGGEGMAIPAAHGLVLINDDAHSQLDIKVTGFQWGWQYEYVGQGVSFVSKLDPKSMAASELESGISPYSVPHYLRNVDHALVVPVGTKVRLLITAVDVIHSWWVPEIGIKKDAIPGYINTSWFEIDANKPGVYRGQCAELCGRGHGYMPIVVDAVSKDDFQAWLKREAAAEKAAAAGAPANGAASS